MEVRATVLGTCGGFIEVLRKIYKFARALRILEQGPLYTREFLSIVSDWGDSFELLKEMKRLGLIERYADRCKDSRGRRCVYNRITDKGREFLFLVDRLVEMMGEDMDSSNCYSE